MFRFIHTADLHLDSPFKGLHRVPEKLKNKLMQSTFDAFNSMIQAAIEAQVDFVLFAGDIFDQSSRSLKAQLAFRRGLEKLAEHDIHSYIIFGNHDPLDGDFHHLHWPSKATLFNAEWNEVPVIKDGKTVAWIQGISYSTNKEKERLVRRFMKTKQAFTIGLLHTNCGGKTDHDHYAPSSVSELLQSGIDYWALGHIHQRQVLHEQPHIVYPGNLQGRHINEQDDKGYYLVEVDENHDVHLQFMPVQHVKWTRRSIDISAISTMNELLNKLAEKRLEWKREEQGSCLIRLELTGETELAQELIQQETINGLAEEWNEWEEHEHRSLTDAYYWLESLHFAGQLPFDRHDWQGSETVYAELLHWFEQHTQDTTLREKMMRNALAEIKQHYRMKKFIAEWTDEEEQEILHQAERLIFTQVLGGDK